MGNKGGDKGCAFLCTTADILDKRPVFVADVKGETKYVFPLYGNGLWGPIWGYVSLNADRQTVYGVYFSHASETPGLGAEITNYEKFQVPFGGKHVMKDGSVALSVVKNGNVKDAEFEVNGLSGATFTSKGVSDMLQKDLSAYAAFLGVESNQ
jgi:Na+-transporting NADH:ubiquinone oxidoreductase subunit C